MRRIAIITLTALLIFTNLNVVSAQKDDGQFQEQIIYDILVDRFNNGDFTIDKQVNIDDPKAYHGGDIQGVIKKLDRLKEMGITTISLSPIMKNAANGYLGYWIEDFYSIDEQFGSMDDFKELIKEAHKRDMKVVMEFVTNYVTASHPITDDPTKKDWIKKPEKTEPEWLSNVVMLNQDNPEVAAYLQDVADFWMTETDVDGFKLHAVDQSSVDFLADFAKHIKDINPDFYLLGDILYTDDNREQLLEDTEIQAIDNVSRYEALTEVFINADHPVKDLYETWKNNGKPTDLIYVDNKYMKRFSQKFAEQNRNDLTVWKLALTYMYTTPGIPVIFQGSEIPMFGGNAEEAQMMVQFNSGKKELQEFHNRIASLRTHFPVLTHGDFEIIGSSGAMSVFKRTYKGESMYIAINNDSTSQSISVDDIASGKQLRGFLGDNIVRENEDGKFKIGLSRESAEVYSVEEDTGLNWGFISFIVGVFVLFALMIILLSRKQKKRNKGSDANRKK